MAKALKRLRVHALPKPKLRLLRMLKRWGSCTSKGEILLNPELIKAAGPRAFVRWFPFHLAS